LRGVRACETRLASRIGIILESVVREQATLVTE
jgi:hypothetical protein